VRTARPIIAIALAAMLAACGGGTPASSGGVPSATGGTPAQQPVTGTPGPGTPTATGDPSQEVPTDGPAIATEDPAGTPTDEPSTEAPTDGPSEAPATPDPSDDAAAAAACSGSDANRSFFAAAAAAVDWPVLCAVLPKGWFVSEGSYRKANGGKLLVSYKGPGGATLSLSEGSFCASGDACVPAGDDLGDAALGSLDGTLVALDSGGFAIIVDGGLSPSWLLVTEGLDQATTLALGGALAEVED
jgi:hypothetical protein